MEPPLKRQRLGASLSDSSHITQPQQTRKSLQEKLKARFEDIFAKYEKDFTGIGDEIDLATGQVVVDNGHLKMMEEGEEVDTGDAWDKDGSEDEDEIAIPDSAKKSQTEAPLEVLDSEGTDPSPLSSGDIARAFKEAGQQQTAKSQTNQAQRSKAPPCPRLEEPIDPKWIVPEVPGLKPLFSPAVPREATPQESPERSPSPEESLWAVKREFCSRQTRGSTKVWSPYEEGLLLHLKTTTCFGVGELKASLPGRSANAITLQWGRMRARLGILPDKRGRRKQKKGLYQIYPSKLDRTSTEIRLETSYSLSSMESSEKSVSWRWRKALSPETELEDLDPLASGSSSRSAPERYRTVVPGVAKQKSSPSRHQHSKIQKRHANPNFKRVVGGAENLSCQALHSRKGDDLTVSPGDRLNTTEPRESLEQLSEFDGPIPKKQLPCQVKFVKKLNVTTDNSIQKRDRAIVIPNSETDLSQGSTTDPSSQLSERRRPNSPEILPNQQVQSRTSMFLLDNLPTEMKNLFHEFRSTSNECNADLAFSDISTETRSSFDTDSTHVVKPNAGNITEHPVTENRVVESQGPEKQVIEEQVTEKQAMVDQAVGQWIIEDQIIENQIIEDVEPQSTKNILPSPLNTAMIMLPRRSPLSPSALSIRPLPVTPRHRKSLHRGTASMAKPPRTDSPSRRSKPLATKPTSNISTPRGRRTCQIRMPRSNPSKQRSRSSHRNSSLRNSVSFASMVPDNSGDELSTSTPAKVPKSLKRSASASKLRLNAAGLACGSVGFRCDRSFCLRCIGGDEANELLD